MGVHPDDSMKIRKLTKVCILSTSYPRFKQDFITPFVHDFAKAISKYHDVFVVASCDKKGKKFQIIDGVRIYRFQYFFPRKLQTLTYTGGMGESFKSGLAKLQTPFFVLSFMFKAIPKCKKADIIHAHWTLPGFVAVIAKKIYKKPVVITLHGGGMRYLPKSFNSFVLRNADFVVGAHDDLIQEAKKLGAKRVINIRNMMDFDKFKNVSGKSFKKEFKIKKEPVITFIARLEPMKDPITFVKAAPYVLKKIPNAKFFVVGDGHLRKDVTETIKKLKLNKNVFFIGPRTDVHKILAATTIFTAISPLENCFSTTIIEAMLSNAPCIVTKAGMTQKFFTHKKDSYLIPAKDERALGNAIVTLIKNPTLRKKIIKGSKSFLRNNGFSEEVIIKKINDVYNEIMKFTSGF